MSQKIYLSNYTPRELEEALGRAMTAVQSINGIKPTHSGNVFVDGVVPEGADTKIVAVVYTPYVENGMLCWENNGGLENPPPVSLSLLSSRAVASINGHKPDENGALTLTPADLGAVPANADVDWQGKRLLGLPDPQTADEAATKSYTDQRACEAYTHTHTGTNHTLSGPEDAPLIRFTAAAAYREGETFTCNGQSVSAKTVGGEDLPEGAFAKDAVVLCCRGGDGTLFFRTGGGRRESVIAVTAPEGSTVSCTCAGNAKTGILQDGLWLFRGCGVGVWNVCAERNGLQVEADVVIEQEDQRFQYNVTLRFSGAPLFSYTGSYALVNSQDEPVSQAGDDWKIRFLTSGTLRITDTNGNEKVDVFLVGGGGGGASRGGGGGGYTTTVKAKALTTGTYTITVGDGGAAGANGAETKAFGASAQGGSSGGTLSGGTGGSGGGTGGQGSYRAGNGGSDGGNGEDPYAQGQGKGQGSTTREFGQSGATLYAGGGGGGGSTSALCGSGGSGGGKGGTGSGSDAIANTGGGGGGGYSGSGGRGGSGIVILRMAESV